MTATTPIYGLSYPEGSDLVSTAPDSFKSMADTFEKALDQVDRRTTPEGVKPAVATTLEALRQITGVIGQTGFVTGGNDDNGPYVWDGAQWVKTRTADMPWNGTWRLNSRTPPGFSIYSLLDYRVITQGKGGSLQPYLATDTYWYSEVTVTPSEIIVRKGASNTSALNVWIVYIYTEPDA